jgi:hypothetical protein
MLSKPDHVVLTEEEQCRYYARRSLHQHEVPHEVVSDSRELSETGAALRDIDSAGDKV